MNNTIEERDAKALLKALISITVRLLEIKAKARLMATVGRDVLDQIEGDS
jgi:hypothetical protein